jgi:hypothetical protein
MMTVAYGACHSQSQNGMNLAARIAVFLLINNPSRRDPSTSLRAGGRRYLDLLHDHGGPITQNLGDSLHDLCRIVADADHSIGAEIARMRQH